MTEDKTSSVVLAQSKNPPENEKGGAHLRASVFVHLRQLANAVSNVENADARNDIGQTASVAPRRCFASRGFTLKVIGNGQSKIEAGSQQLHRRFDNSEGMLA